MSIWTYKLQLALIGAVVGLAACDSVPGISMGSNAPGVSNQAPERIVVAGKSVVIAGPPGYCVDKASTRDSDDVSFVLLGSCQHLAKAGANSLPAPGLLTASVSAASSSAISSSLGRLESFFESEAGRAALARDGRAESVEILDTRQHGNAFYIHARDSSSNTVSGISEDYWRGLFDVRGRIVTVSVVGFEQKPMSDSVGFATVDAFASRIIKENPVENDGVTYAAEPKGLFSRFLQ